jgi:hypothetical protein
MNTAWLTGRITEAEMEEEHPLELEKLRQSKLEQAAQRRQAARRKGGAHGQ